MTHLLGRPAVLRLTPGNVATSPWPRTCWTPRDRSAAFSPTRGYDANGLRKRLKPEGATAVIPGGSHRKAAIRYNETRYRGRWRIEAAFCRLKDFRRVATRYDKLARNFLSAVALATLIAFWV
ncbi:transposase [Faunimonas sp. B44]|uniref:transposase n=1 Tax=Faunimonas sp. B44 TaxID=3461493 RepID=UPI004044E3CB